MPNLTDKKRQLLHWKAIELRSYISLMDSSPFEMPMISMRAALGSDHPEKLPRFSSQFIFDKVKSANIRLFGDIKPPTTAIAYHRFSDMI